MKYPLTIDSNKIVRDFSVVINIFKNGATVLTPDNEILSITVPKSIKGGDLDVNDNGEKIYDGCKWKDYDQCTLNSVKLMNNLGLNIPVVSNNNTSKTGVNELVKTKLDDKVYIVCFHDNDKNNNKTIYYIYGIQDKREYGRSKKYELDYYTKLEHENRLEIEIVEDKILNRNCIIHNEEIRYLKNSEGNFVDFSNLIEANRMIKFNSRTLIDYNSKIHDNGKLKLIMTVKKDQEDPLPFYNNLSTRIEKNTGYNRELYQRIETNHGLKSIAPLDYKLVTKKTFDDQIKAIIKIAKENTGADNKTISVYLTNNEDTINKGKIKH